MGQYIDLVGELVQMAKEGESQERQEFTGQLRGQYLSAFQSLRNKLQASYVNERFKTNIEDREAIGQTLKDNILKTFASSKGGADILTKSDLREYLKNEELRNKLKMTRNYLYEVVDQNQYKRYALQMMGLVYNLKKDITGIEEHFSFIYKGESGAAVYFDIPVTNFLFHPETLNLINLQYGALSRWNGGIDQNLRFKSSIGSQLSTIYTSGQEKNFENFDFINRRKQEISFKKEYKRYSNAVKKAEELGIDIPIYREDAAYYVVEKKGAQSGFVDQGLFGQYINKDNKASFKGDNRDWFKEPDVTDRKINQGYSVKSFLGSNPSLVSLSSLYQVSSTIITALSSPANTKDVINNLNEQVFKAAETIDSVANADIQKALGPFAQ